MKKLFLRLPKNLMQDLVPLARPYAKAIFDAAVDSGSTSETQASLKSLAAGFKEKAITDLISSPTLSRSEILKNSHQYLMER